MTCERLYAIQVGEDGPIKIGQSHYPVKRLAALQGASPYPLRITYNLPNENGLERAVHAKLAEHRLRGEWFANHPDVVAVLDSIVENGPPALDPPPAPIEYAEVPDFVITRRTNPSTCAEIIEAIGPKVVRDTYRMSRQRLHVWKKRGIPIAYRVAVARLATMNGVAVPPDFFKGMAS